MAERGGVLLLLGVLLLVGRSDACATSGDCFVDPAGSDSNDCTSGSQCATVGRALTLANAITDGIIITLKPGYYGEAEHDVSGKIITFQGENVASTQSTVMYSQSNSTICS